MASSKKSSLLRRERPEPMQATLAKKPFNDPNWIYEVKWDGYRLIASVHNKQVQLYSRNGLDYTKKYQIITDDLKTLKGDLIVDGEIVVLNENGHPDYDALQAYKGGGELMYYVFDLLYANGTDLRSLPLENRKQKLRALVPDSNHLQFSESFDDGVALYEQVKDLGLEGIVGKKRSSLYESGKRSKNWLKYPLEIRKDYVIGGWTESASGRAFRSLLFGYYEGSKFKYLGHAGAGYKDEMMPSILKRLKACEISKSPFTNEVDAKTKVHWVKPELIAEIKYATLTRGGKIRKPAIFLGFRDDKHMKDVDKPIKTVGAKSTSAKPIGDSNWGKIESQEIRNRTDVNIDAKALELTNVDRQIWKNISKADLIEYYHNMAHVMLPYLVDRPQSMHIKWIGANRPGFYVKDMEGRGPAWLQTFSIKRKHKAAGKRDIIDYLLCNDEATLLYMINLGCIDINPWTAVTLRPDQPDYIIIDLDPSDDDYQKVIETAKAAHDLFSRYKLKAFLKTSGKSGMHIYIPVRTIRFPQARSIAVRICSEIHALVPGITTTEISVDNRGTKLYVDPNQNDEADTIAAPYSARPWQLPTVSTPLEWKELKSSLDPSAFTIHTIEKRLQKKGDVFLKVNDEATALKNTARLKAILNID